MIFSFRGSLFKQIWACFEIVRDGFVMNLGVHGRLRLTKHPILLSEKTPPPWWLKRQRWHHRRSSWLQRRSDGLRKRLRMD